MVKQNKQKIDYFKTINKNIIDVLELLAKVDPKFLSKISPILNRDISEESIKDTEDYNLAVVSRYVDRGINLLMEAGLSRTQSLDLIKVMNDKIGKEDFQDLLNNKKIDYQKIPFLHNIESDIRAHFILKTNKSDDYSTLFKELDELMPSFMKQEEWDFLKDCINRGNKRLNSIKIKFPLPINGYNEGDKISVSEKEQLHFLKEKSTDFYYCNKPDEPDMLALKELINILKGSEVHPLTIGPGFFLKYLPEIRYRTLQKEGIESVYPLEWGRGLNEDKSYWWNNTDENFIKSIPASYDGNKDWDGIVFKVNEKTKKLESIAMAKVPDPTVIQDGATMASLLLYYSQTYITKRNWKKRREGTFNSLEIDYEPFLLERKDGKIRYSEKSISTITGKNKKYKEPIVFNRSSELSDIMTGFKYYVLADSQVSGPKSGFPYLNEEVSINNNIVDAGECYLFENNKKLEDSYIATRLYFYSYNPSLLNPMLQHGSVIFGSNDQSFHPCLRYPLDKKWNEVITQLTKNKSKNNHVKNFNGKMKPINKLENKDFNHESNSLIARMLFCKKIDGSFNNSSHVIELTSECSFKEHSRLFRYEFDFSPRMFIAPWLILQSQFGNKIYSEEDNVVTNVLGPLLEFFLPFNQRFSILKYKQDFKGIELEKQLTVLEVLSRESEAEHNIHFIHICKKLHEIKDIQNNNGLSYDEALTVYEKKIQNN